jgi:hypothetical protein
MQTKTALIMSLIVASMAIAFAGVIAHPALADKSSGQRGVDRADAAIHEHQGPHSNTDQRFHFGTCQGGFGAGGFLLITSLANL